MRAADLVVGESYRHKDHPNYCWAKVVEVLAPKAVGNPFNRIIIKCEYSENKNASFGIIKHFKASDLVIA